MPTVHRQRLACRRKFCAHSACLTEQRQVPMVLLTGPPLQLCQEVAYEYGMLTVDLLAGGARLVVLPVVQAVGIGGAAMFQLLLPLCQVTNTMPSSVIAKTVSVHQRNGRLCYATNFARLPLDKYLHKPVVTLEIPRSGMHADTRQVVQIIRAICMGPLAAMGLCWSVAAGCVAIMGDGVVASYSAAMAVGGSLVALAPVSRAAATATNEVGSFCAQRFPFVKDGTS